MRRRLHLSVLFGTFEVRKDPQGRLYPARLIGYEFPDNLPEILSMVEKKVEPHLQNRHDSRLTMPGVQMLRQASPAELERWAEHIVSGGAIPAPGTRQATMPPEVREFLRARVSYQQFEAMKQIAAALVRGQEEFMKTGEWLARRRLTIRMVARSLSACSERTVARIVHALKLQYNGMTFPAALLLYRSNEPDLARILLPVAREHPQWGAPRLASALQQQGLQVSERAVGHALASLRRRLLL